MDEFYAMNNNAKGWPKGFRIPLALLFFMGSHIMNIRSVT